MNLKTICLPIMLSAFILLQGHATATNLPGQTADTTHPRRWNFTLGLGFTNNSAFGSQVDLEHQENVYDHLPDAKQKNGGSFEINAGFQKYISDIVYFRFGLGFIEKRVNPEENTIILYKDSLKTGYLTLPLVFGFAQPVDLKKTVMLVLEAGPSVNFKLFDKTYKAPDRVGYQTFSAVADILVGGGIAFQTAPGVRLGIMYHFSEDLTPAYKETLYWGGNPLYKTDVYKFRTSSISMGFQWTL